MDPASSNFLILVAAALLLIGSNAAFIAAEFSLVAVRRSRIDALQRAGKRRARHVTAALERPDDFLATAQVGISLASVGIGYLAALFLHGFLTPGLVRLAAVLPAGVSGLAGTATALLALTLAVVFVVGIHAALGALVPKLLAVARPEGVAMLTAGPTLAFGVVFRPFIRLCAGTARVLVRLLGVEPAGAPSLARTPDEIRILVERSLEEGMVEADEEQMIHGVFECRDLRAREVMTPRPDIVAVPADATLQQVLAPVAASGHSRIPVYDGDLDEIIGILLVKDLIPFLADARQRDFDLRALLREPYFVPDTKRVDDLLAEFRANSVHMAIVLDEFGGTDGLVTLEDLLEEIVGDIYDEHDRRQPDDFALASNGDILMDGGTSIAEVNQRFGLELPEKDFDTIGGFVFGEIGRVPMPGDTITIAGAGVLRVEQIDERRVTRVRFSHHARTAAAD